MPSPDQRILVVDGNPAIHGDILKILQPGGPSQSPLAGLDSVLFGAASAGPVLRCQVDSALDCETALRMALAARAEGWPYSVAFVDMRLPEGYDGAETTARLWQVDAELQVVIFSALMDNAWEDLRSRLGVTDNLLILKKPFAPAEIQQLAAALTRKWEWARQARQQMAEMERLVEGRSAELRHSEERFSIAFKAAPMPQAILNFTTGQVTDVNEAFTALTGFTREEILAHSHGMLHHSGFVVPLREPQPLRSRECAVTEKNGSPRRILLSTQPTTIAGQPHLIIMAEDISQRVQLEQQLRHSQKMEGVGQLAAGVAHDFNNILTIIQGHLSLVLGTQDFAPECRSALTETLHASERAATLTRQLLAFSRKQLFKPAPFDLNVLISDQSAMLKRLIGEHILTEWECDPILPAVLGDAPSLELVVTNLVLNARDAMPQGGRLRISTGVMEISPARAAQNPEARPGKFVRFSVTDTGHGMDEATRERIFEPFFTTRVKGEGTGMGLATVYGIVKQHEGWLEVYSEPSQGTSIFVYLPITSALAENTAAPLLPTQPGGVALTVLLVEDEPAVRSIMRQLLRHCGCQVIEAGDARDGYARWTENRDRIDLLVTDIVMPGGATGHDLARQLLDERPELKVIYSSGYSADLFQQGSDLIPGRNFLPKPYDADSVFRLIRRVASEKTETLTA